MHWAVYTDLDGTLLDHETYQFDAALPAVNALCKLGVPVVPVTSKTRAEIQPILRALKLNSPMVVENGAAAFIPKSEFSSPGDGMMLESEGYWIKEFSPKLTFWVGLVKQLSVEIPGAFAAFSDMSVAQVAELTGLSMAQAELASTREYSNPLHWYGSESDFTRMKHYCAERQVDVVRGGRFVHLLKGANKGKAVIWVHEFLAQSFGNRTKSVALGDGENDLSMLAEVDYAVQIKSPAHEFPEFQAANLYRTAKFGPEGWREAIENIILNNTENNYTAAP